MEKEFDSFQNLISLSMKISFGGEKTLNLNLKKKFNDDNDLCKNIFKFENTFYSFG